MNHKRRRPKQQRAGCLFCKPHKANCSKDSAESVPASVRRKTVDMPWELVEEMIDGWLLDSMELCEEQDERSIAVSEEAERHAP